jgi:hypothetical protein
MSQHLSALASSPTAGIRGGKAGSFLCVCGAPIHVQEKQVALWTAEQSWQMCWGSRQARQGVELLS